MPTCVLNARETYQCGYTRLYNKQKQQPAKQNKSEYKSKIKSTNIKDKTATVIRVLSTSSSSRTESD